MRSPFPVRMLNPKIAVLRIAERLGAGAALGRSGWRQRRLLILCYHGVSLGDEHEADPALYVSPAFLRARLVRIRRRGCTVVPLAEGLRRLRAGTLPRRAVALTFDDGTRDFAELAVPMLRELGMPATVYVTTYYSERPLPVFDTALRYLLWRGRGSGVGVEDLAGASTAIPLVTGEDRAAAWTALYERARTDRLDAVAKDALLRRVAARVGVDYDGFLRTGMFQQMTPAQIGALPRDLVDVQLHTHRHRAPRDAREFAREIADNRERLDEFTGGTPTTHFCYPGGDYRADFVRWLPALGVESATTCVPDLAAADTDPLLLPRFIDTSTTPDVVFDAWLSGVASFVPRRAEYRFDPARLGP